MGVGEKLLTDERLLQPGKVAILDGGAQYVDLIRKACVRLGYHADILPLDTPFHEIEDAYGGFILSGGPASSLLEGAPMPDPAFWGTKKAALGICYGQQAMALAFGGTVESGVVGQDGAAKTSVSNTHPLFERTKPDIEALFTHGDVVTEAPEGFTIIGQHILSNGSTVISAIAKENFAAVQFHPEVFDETPHGYDIFRGFLEGMCSLAPDPELLDKQAQADIDHRKEAIAEQAGDRHVIAFASGGIDSTVATILAAKVIEPEKLHICYFDNGFMRDEDDLVIEMLQGLGIAVERFDVGNVFEQATWTDEAGVEHGPLVEVSDPKIKRKIVGKTFVDLKNQIATSLNLSTDEVMLLQGTNAADRIESGFSLSGGRTTEQIKEHHNQVKEIKDLEAAGLLLEPLNDLHKNEIRHIAEQLGLPEEIAWRHPFPGPGNVIRILAYRPPGEYEMPDPTLQQEVSDHVMAAFPFEVLDTQLLPTRSVGVGGDARSYVLPAALQGHTSWEILSTLATSEEVGIPARFRGKVNRVVYALGPHPLANLAMAETSLGRVERAQIRQVDAIVFEEIRRFGLMRAISQCPVVLLPLSFDGLASRSIVLRPIRTSTYLTAKALLPGRDVDEQFIIDTSRRILQEVASISQVFLELTNKPPATTEWE